MKPSDMRQIGDKELLISWDDSHRSLYAYKYLRLNCACAQCVDEWTGGRLITLDKISDEIHVKDIKPVGNYGVRFVWSDGHQTGIYSFDQLRSMCSCSNCKKEKS